MNGNNRASNSLYARHRGLVWTAGIMALVVFLASFVSRDKTVQVRADTVERGTIRSVISTNGKLEPVRDFQAHSPIGTTVKRILVNEGSHVKKGQLLVQLDDAEPRSQAARALAQVRAAQATVAAVERGGNREEVLTLEADIAKTRSEHEAAQRNLDALQRLAQKGAAAPGEVKEAQNRLDRAAADLKLLEQKRNGRYSLQEVAQVQAQREQAAAAYQAAQDVLAQLNIRAPFEGVVYSLPVRVGAYVNPGDLVLQEADLTTLLVRTFVDEPDIGRLAQGQKIDLTWDAVPGRIWNGTVSMVPASVKLRGTRNVGEVTCEVDNSDLKLLPNTNVGVTIVTAEHPNVLIVPREAIRQEDDKTFVYQISNNGELQRRDIQTAISDLTHVEVTRGVGEHARVVVTAMTSRPLYNGLPVKVIQ